MTYLYIYLGLWISLLTRERQKFLVSMQGNVDVPSNALHTLVSSREGGRRVVYVEQPSRKRVGRSIGTSSAAYTLVHMHIHACTRVHAFQVAPVLYRRCEYANRHACVHALSRSREADSRAVAIMRGRGTWGSKVSKSYFMQHYSPDILPIVVNAVRTSAFHASIRLLKMGFAASLRAYTLDRVLTHRNARGRSTMLWHAARTKRRGQIEMFIAKVNASLTMKKRPRSGTKFVLRLA